MDTIGLQRQVVWAKTEDKMCVDPQAHAWYESKVTIGLSRI